MVYLVRHAHAGSQKRWSGRDHDRPLSVRGEEQANGHLASLGDEPLTRILPSPAVRCRQTVTPLGHAHRLPVELADSLAVHAVVQQLLELVLDPSMQAAVLCGHGGQIGGLLRLVIERGRGGPLPRQKGSIWILDTNSGGVTAGHYVPPLRLRSPAGTRRC